MKTKNISLSLPVPAIDVNKLTSNLVNKFSKLLEYLKKLTSALYSSFVNLVKTRRQQRGDFTRERTSKFKLPKFNFPKFNLSKFNLGKVWKPLLAAAIFGLFIFFGSRLFKDLSGGTRTGTQIEVKGAKASQALGREFLFPLRNGEGENLSDIRFFIDKVEKRDEIIVKGKRATSIKGRTFLIITLKITNQYSQAITMNTRDYVRLSVNGNKDEWLAPDIHNDPVEIQALSTKLTRVGFPIYDTDSDLVFRVGEIDGEKEEIPLDLK